MWAHPGKQLLFMGSEFAQYAEWSEARGLDWWLLENADHHGVQQCLRDLNRVYKETPALWDAGQRPRAASSGSTPTTPRATCSRGCAGAPTARRSPAITNFSRRSARDYRVGLPARRHWHEVLNTDAEAYGGSGVGNLGAVQAEEVPWHGRPFSAIVRVPPLGALWLRPA